MNFYTKVLSKFASGKGLTLTVTVEAAPEGGISSQKVEETKVALRELGLKRRRDVNGRRGVPTRPSLLKSGGLSTWTTPPTAAPPWFYHIAVAGTGRLSVRLCQLRGQAIATPNRTPCRCGPRTSPGSDCLSPCGGAVQPVFSRRARGTMTMAPVSVVIPAYNEEGSIHAVVEHVQQVLSGAGVEHEIVVVDDGSSDQTAARRATPRSSSGTRRISATAGA